MGYFKKEFSHTMGLSDHAGSVILFIFILAYKRFVRKIEKKCHIKKKKIID